MPELKPRRRPKRRTSQSIVTAILDAAGELLVSSGIEGMTTNAVATRAGVSVGSLYQYFPNKEAVCAGIGGRVNQKLVEGLRSVMARDISPEAQLEGAIDVICSSEIGSYEVRKALLDQFPRTWKETGVVASEREVTRILAPMFEALAPDLEPKDRAARQRVGVFAVKGAVQALLVGSPELLDRPAVRAWMREMVLTPLRMDAALDRD